MTTDGAGSVVTAWLHDNRWCWLCGHGLAAWQQMVLALWSRL